MNSKISEEIIKNNYKKDAGCSLSLKRSNTISDHHLLSKLDFFKDLKQCDMFGPEVKVRMYGKTRR